MIKIRIDFTKYERRKSMIQLNEWNPKPVPIIGFTVQNNAPFMRNSYAVSHKLYFVINISLKNLNWRDIDEKKDSDYWWSSRRGYCGGTLTKT
nr:hypothetical protein [uncultured Lachnoclostridium sp.]